MIYVHAVSLCMNAHKGVGTRGGQKASGSLELELQIGVSLPDFLLVLRKSRDT